MSSLDNLRKTAKRWLKAVRANEPEARGRLLRAYPTAPLDPTLRDVQHALALEQGADSWKALKARLESQSAPAPVTELFTAAGKGDAAQVAAILDQHPDIINTRAGLEGHDGKRTALHFGVAHEPVVRLLLERGADPNIRDDGDRAFPIHFAAENQDFPVIRLLVEHGASLDGAGDHHELDVIGWACCWDYRDASKEIVDYLLEHGARHHIFSAVAMGEVEIVRQLVAADSTLLTRRMDHTNRRRTPLHEAVVKKQLPVVEALIALGSELEAEDAVGLTPLDQAALQNEREIADLLISKGADLRLPAAVALQRTADIGRILAPDPNCLKPGQRYGTLIVRAARSSPGHVIETLVKHGASVNVRDDTETSVDRAGGYTALHAAAFHGNDSAARALMKHGADLTVRDDKYGSTPAGWADYAGHKHLRDVILRGPIDIFDAIAFDITERIPQLLKTDPGALNRPYGDYGQGSRVNMAEKWVTPLAAAVMCNNVEATKYLLEEKANLTVAPDGRSLLDLAAKPGHEQIARVLREHIGSKVEPMPGSHPERVALFLNWACWDHTVHGKGDHRMCDAAAQRLLAHYPEIARDSLYTAVVCGDIREVERMLTERPATVGERGGARHWTPLLYLSYARFSHQPAIDNALAMMRLLLDGGADPNDYYMAGHSRYSTLVGIAREGEQDAPPHPRREELFALLLERGAYMYDAQVLYNNHFSGDILWWLKLVHAHAVKNGRTEEWDDPNWTMLDMGGYGPGALFILECAVRKNDVALAEWALTHGASPNAINPKHPRLSGRHTLYAEAVRRNRTEIADLLRRHGANTVIAPLEGEAAFIDACLRLDRDEAARLAAAHPEYLRSPEPMFTAAKLDRPDALALLLDLGVPLEIADHTNARALHHAASGNAISAAQFLIERGAEIDPRESNWGAVPIGWAAHGDRQQMVDLLSQYSRNVWTLAFRGYVERVREVLREDPTRAQVKSDEGITPLWWLPDDEDKALQIAELLIAHGADPAAQSVRGTTAADWARKRGMLRLERRLRT